MHSKNRPTDDPQVGVAPRAKLCDPAQVLVTDVEAANVANFTVQHHDFPVVPVVNPKVEEVAPGHQERRRVPAQITQVRVKARLNPHGTPGIIKDPHLNTLSCLLLEQGPQLVPDAVIVNGIKLNVDTFLCCGNVIKHLLEQLVAVGKDRHPVVPAEEGFIDTLKEHNRPPVNLRDRVLRFGHVAKLLFLPFHCFF